MPAPWFWRVRTRHFLDPSEDGVKEVLLSRLQCLSDALGFNDM